MSQQGRESAGRALEALAELAARLRAPDGCPWDREQTPASAAAYLLEEAYEATEAIESGTIEEVRGELGDLLFQVVFQAQLFAEAGHFDLAEVIDEVRTKMVRRHPHVFGEARARDAGEVRQRWSEIKREERRGTGRGLLDSVPLGAPALLRAQRLGSKAAKVGFDWDDAAGVWEKSRRKPRSWPRPGRKGRRPSWATCSFPGPSGPATGAWGPRPPCARPTGASPGASGPWRPWPPGRAAPWIK